MNFFTQPEEPYASPKETTPKNANIVQKSSKTVSHSHFLYFVNSLIIILVECFCRNSLLSAIRQSQRHICEFLCLIRCPFECKVTVLIFQSSTSTGSKHQRSFSSSSFDISSSSSRNRSSSRGFSDTSSKDTTSKNTDSSMSSGKSSSFNHDKHRYWASATLEVWFTLLLSLASHKSVLILFYRKRAIVIRLLERQSLQGRCLKECLSPKLW